jgi:hypothetical protein
MSESDVTTLRETINDLLMRVELLETRISFCEDYIREQEARREAAENPDVERSFRHA